MRTGLVCRAAVLVVNLYLAARGCHHESWLWCMPQDGDMFEPPWHMFPRAAAWLLQATGVCLEEHVVPVETFALCMSTRRLRTATSEWGRRENPLYREI